MSRIKSAIRCPYCETQANIDTKVKAQREDQTRYGCENGHYFAVPTSSVTTNTTSKERGRGKSSYS